MGFYGLDRTYNWIIQIHFMSFLPSPVNNIILKSRNYSSCHGVIIIIIHPYVADWLYWMDVSCSGPLTMDECTHTTHVSQMMWWYFVLNWTLLLFHSCVRLSIHNFTLTFFFLPWKFIHGNNATQLHNRNDWGSVDAVIMVINHRHQHPHILYYYYSSVSSLIHFSPCTLFNMHSKRKWSTVDGCRSLRKRYFYFYH